MRRDSLLSRLKIYYSKFARDHFFVQCFNAQNKSTEERFFFYKDRLIFGLDDPVANMSIRHVYYAWELGKRHTH